MSYYVVVASLPTCSLHTALRSSRARTQCHGVSLRDTDLCAAFLVSFRLYDLRAVLRSKAQRVFPPNGKSTVAVRSSYDDVRWWIRSLR